MFNESNVREIFRDRWDGWMDTIQPGLGGTVGIPDTQVLIAKKLAPIELKWAEMAGGRMVPKRIRPDQISWHTRFALAGGKSYFIIGVNEWDMFIADAMYAIAARKDGLIPQGTKACSKLSFSSAKGVDNLFSDSVRAFVGD